MKHTVGFAAVVTAMMVIALIVGGAYMVVVLATRHEPIETIGVTFLLGLGVLFSLWLIITPRQATISGLVFGVLCVGAIPRHIIPFSGAFMGLRLCFVSLALLMSIRKFSRCHVRSKRNPYAILLVFYTLIVLLWLPKSPAFTYGIQKTVEFILNATVPMLAFAGLGPYDENDCKVIATTLIVWAIVAAVSLLVVGNIGSYRSVRSEGENAIMTARVIGLGAVSQVGVIVSGSRKRIGACVAQLAILGVTIAAMIATRSRGPFLALILIIIVVLMLSRQYDGRWRGFWRILAYFGGLLILG
ncbi:MAG: hypothetical protein GX795_12495, partial [Firmicutes bacterium]|nr:hypothetical protein [Bacillota bacterium]